MARKRVVFFPKRLTWLGHWFLGVSLALLIGLKPSLATLPSLTIAASPALNSTLLTATDASQLLQQGREFYQTGQFSQAATVWQQAAQSYQSQGNKLNQAVALSYLSLAYQQLGELSQATQAITNSLDLLQTEAHQNNSSSQLPILAQALNTKGSLELAQGQAEQALTTWQQAAATYSKVGDQEGQIGCLINQAQAQQALGFYLRARQTLAGVEQTLAQQPDLELKSTGLLSLGNVLRLVGDFKESERILKESLAVAEQLALPYDLGTILLSLGNTAHAQQDNDTALTYYQQAAAQSTSKTTQLQARLNQLSVLIEGKRASDAQTLLPQIQSELSNLPPSQTAVYAQINFGMSLMKLSSTLGDTPNTMDKGKITKDVAQILAKAVQQAKTLGDRRSLSLALGSLGGLYEETQQWTDAEDLTQQALILSQAINASDISYRWQWQLGRLLKVQNDSNGAIAAYGEAINTLQSLRSDLVAINSEVQFSFREAVEPVYREFVSLLLQDNNTETPPEQLERARKVIESLQLAELDNFFRAACLNATSVEIDTVDRKAAVIYPIILPDRLEVIVSLPQQPLRHYSTALTQDQIESDLAKLRQNLTRRISSSYLDISQQVYNWLIRPVERDLSATNVETLVFVLDGSLRNIPMAALYDGEQFLIQKYAISVAPGLELLDPKPLGERKLQVLTAGLSDARQEFPPLPNVEIEIKEIESLVSTKVLFNQDFTKANIQNALSSVSFPVVHLATHGQFSSNAEGTFILTWDDRIDVNELNNLLQTSDLSRSQPIELLVLSACETAKGDKRAALGIAGVAVRAGARSTLATLWSVSDEATATLMGQFYKELTSSSITKAQALRQAQLSILQNPKYEKHPYYWAPFVLVGNWL
ncbi:MAG TPA: hypothetical protein DCY91_01385 [Cyanobacteria bacterium UBA11370]|nr:hypothetical protein [Cyanobacteria bacterium UBA11370]HBY77743.1 hypothetical protein [Cyanobacteria bacterium UBA11148]